MARRRSTRHALRGHVTSPIIASNCPARAVMRVNRPTSSRAKEPAQRSIRSPRYRFATVRRFLSLRMIMRSMQRRARRVAATTQVVSIPLFVAGAITQHARWRSTASSALAFRLGIFCMRRRSRARSGNRRTLTRWRSPSSDAGVDRGQSGLRCRRWRRRPGPI